MKMNPIGVVRDPMILSPDQKRVLLRPFFPGDSQRIAGIAARVAALADEEVRDRLDEISMDFSKRHQHVRSRFIEAFERSRNDIPGRDELSEERRMVIGSCLLAEYSLESAALFNPSIVPHPDQTNLPAGSLRFVLSLRATGEGHISSITFRSGILHPGRRIEVARAAGFLIEPERIVNPLEDEGLHTYQVRFSPDLDLSQRILFPGTPAQRNGIEDARFVLFEDDDGTRAYYATFTAYDGRTITPELLRTSDFLRFRFFTLHGAAARNKGMALFPRRIGGRFAMLGRQDNENIHVMYSDSIHSWTESTVVLAPQFPWELVQLGNCGSPMETSAGWLVLTHGVGPMRTYCIGAFLLDLEDPSKVIGRLREPLLRPNVSEREGYVPNVVYSCGGMLYEEHLILPYGLADHATGFATIPLAEILAAMEPCG